ncbi:MAG: MarR family EPS-associated transcriptional regulator [Thermoanaerobaculia bacterium]
MAMTHPISDEIRYRLLTYLNEHPEASQRDVAAQLGVSVGKVNYCLRALMTKGLVKVRNFRNSSNKRSYAYVLTPRGLEEKVDVTVRFLKRKIEEYNAVSQEIERLNREIHASTGSDAESAAGMP